MPARRLAPVVLLALTFFAGRIEAGKVPLRPEELEKESKLIVTGQVLSHREEDKPENDGSVTRHVHLTVKIDAVAKGEAKPGDEIQVRCWVVVKEPRDGMVWDSGHRGIPSDGGKAKFFLTGPHDGAWHAIYPNGIELLDQTPPLRYEREKANPIEKAAGGTPLWVLGGGAALLVLLGVGIWFAVSKRKPNPSA